MCHQLLHTINGLPAKNMAPNLELPKLSILWTLPAAKFSPSFEHISSTSKKLHIISLDTAMKNPDIHKAGGKYCSSCALWNHGMSAYVLQLT